MADPQQQMTAQDFAQSVRAKYPGSYDHLSDQDLTQKVVTKYPQYKSVIPNAGLADPASAPPIPEPKSTTDQLTEIQKPDPNNRWSPMEAVKAVGNVGAGAMTPIIHPIDTLTSGARLASEAYTYPYLKAMGKPTATDSLVKGAIENPYGTAESGIGQAATMKAASEIPAENLAAPVRGVVKAGNSILKNPTVQKVAPYAGTAIGYAAGEAAGHPWMGAGLGGAVGRAIHGGVTIPGERLGLPPEPPLYDQSVFDRAAAKPKSELFDPMTDRQGVPQPPDRGGSFRAPMQGPTNKPNVVLPDSGPMKADVSKLGPPAGVGKYQPPERIPPPVRTAPIQPAPVVEAKPAQVSMADQIATAKGLGFKNLGDAISKFGYEGWQRVIASPTAPPTASIGPIGKPTPFERPYTPEHIPTNRARLADLLDDQGVKQEMEGEQGPRSMVTGRKGGSVSLLPNESTSLAGEGRMAELERGRELAAGNAVDQTKGSLIGQYRGIAAPRAVADIQAARPLPGSDVAANRTVGGKIRPGDEEFDYITGKRKK